MIRRWSRRIPRWRASAIINASFSLYVVGLVCGKQSDPATVEHLLARAAVERARGDPSVAQRDFLAAYQLAERAGDRHQSRQALVGLGACQIELFAFRAAGDSLRRARDSALADADLLIGAKAELNLSSLYFELHDLEAANQISHESVQRLKSLNQKALLAKALINQGSIEFELHLFEAGQHDIQDALGLAKGLNLPLLEALALEYLGESALEVERLDHTLSSAQRVYEWNLADNALHRAYELRIQEHDTAELPITRLNLADLAFRRGNYRQALRELDDVKISSGNQLSALPRYRIPQLRGRILEAMGRFRAALTHFGDAAAAASAWRSRALPSDVTSSTTVEYLDSVYADYAHLAARLSISTHDNRLARRALEVLAENRAANLREQLELAFERQDRFPPQYYHLLQTLQQAEAGALWRQTDSDAAALRRIRFEISRIEDAVGLTEPGAKALRTGDLVSHIQDRLGVNDVLLAYSIGHSDSYVWLITAKGLSLSTVARKAELQKLVEKFNSCMQRSKMPDDSGFALSRAIFGNLPALAWNRPNWLIVADGPLLDMVPFSALPALVGPQMGMPLMLTHSLRLIPSESLFARTPAERQSPERFLGIGDPVYNLADPRKPKGSLNGRYESTPILGRLVDSNREVRTAAAASGLTIQLLTGPEASARKVIAAVAGPPAFIHFAVHILSPPQHPEQAALILTIMNDGTPQLLTPETIAALKIPGSLVVLSGCSSGQGRIMEAAGLMGLSRAWLLAGAAAVVVSAWPIPDGQEGFFQVFYKTLKTQGMNMQSLPERSALALRCAQVDMYRRDVGGRRVAVWGAYSVIARN